MKLIDGLKELLKEDTRFVDGEGNLLKNKIIEHALKLDKDLNKLLLKDERTKCHFFKDIDGVLVFDREKFMKFIDNKKFLPDSYTAFKNKIGLANEEGKYLAKSKEVVLVWPYKDCVLEGGQGKPDEKRKEIFHNVILAPDEIDRLLEPKVFTNFKRIDKDGEHLLDGFRRDAEINRKKGLPEDTITDNLIIKGNNLLVLHSLLKEFREKVKLIYIDPPYNTGNDDFKYNDNFKHSTWLTFMKNRLEVAKELLREDGIIFVQIDDREHAYLKVLMDEIFGRENFISSIAIKVKAPSGVATGGLIFDVKENILVYARNDKSKIEPINNKIQKEIINECSETIKSYNYIFIDEGEEGEVVDTLETSTGVVEIRKHTNYRIQRINFSEVDDVTKYYVENFSKIFRTASLSGGIEQKIKKLIPDHGLYSYHHTPLKGKYSSRKIKYYVYKKEQILWLKDSAEIIESNGKKLPIKLEQISNIITLNLWQGISKEGSVSLKWGKKPERLIKLLISLVTKPEDIVLDFFLGSGTSCAVTHKMGRQYIGVEQLDYGENSAVVRLKNVINGDPTGISKEVDWQGDGDFVYMELLKLNKIFVGKIQEAETTEELLNIWEDMKHNGFLSYKVDPGLFDENIEEFKALNLDEQKKLLLEMLEYNDLYVNYSEIDDAIYNVNEEDKKLNGEFYES